MNPRWRRAGLEVIAAGIVCGLALATWIAFRPSPAPLGLKSGEPRATAQPLPSPSATLSSDVAFASACPTPSPLSARSANGISGVWVVEEGAEAGYRVKEVWNSVTLPHEAVARTNDVRGWALVTAATPGARLDQACFAVDLASLHSIDPPALPGQQVSGRDEALGLVLDYAKHPVARLTIASTGITPSIGGSTAHLTIPGTLEIAGVVRPVNFDTQIQLNADAVSVAGKTGITRDDFHIQFGQGAPVDIDQHVTIEFSLVMRRP